MAAVFLFLSCPCNDEKIKKLFPFLKKSVIIKETALIKRENKMNIAICDDEPVFIERLKLLLKKEFEKHGECYSVITANRGDKLLSACSKEKTDAVFLDIDMPGLDGFETAERLRKISENIMIVFVSSKENTVFRAYEYDPVWFVPKTQIGLLERAVDKIVKKARNMNEEAKFTQIRLGNEAVEIDVRKIKYFKTDGHYINYYDRDGQKSSSFRCKLDEAETQLSALWFVKTHKSYLVNLRNTRSISDKDIVLYDNEKIPISRAQMGIVREKFQDYLRSMR